MKPIIYSKCAQTFRQFYSGDINLVDKFVKKLINVKLFDVTLRDGLQGLTKEEQLNITPIDKINMYYQIKEKYEPKYMEIGSIVSNKILPVFNDSDSFYNYIEYCQLDPDEPKIINCILIPNESQFQNINKFIGLRNFSFITSVSDSFQIKNTKMTLDTTFQQIENMTNIIKKTNDYFIKLYISCINECPIEGKIDNNKVIETILKYQTLNPTMLCLSDTCGTLTENDLVYIVSNLNINKNHNNLSLHLHVKSGREDEVEKLIHTALDLGIETFDVSAINRGGCSVTMNQTELAPNLSYELYYKSLASYILKN